jgi:hypothetical protein
MWNAGGQKPDDRGDFAAAADGLLKDAFAETAVALGVAAAGTTGAATEDLTTSPTSLSSTHAAPSSSSG